MAMARSSWVMPNVPTRLTWLRCTFFSSRSFMTLRNSFKFSFSKPSVYFAVAVTVTGCSEASPEAGSKVSQSEGDAVTAHGLLERTVNVCLPPSFANFSVKGVMVILPGTPWMNFTRVGFSMPSPSIVSVASRDAEPVLSSNFTMIVSASELSLLLDGVTLHQFSLLVIVHGVFAAAVTAIAEIRNILFMIIKIYGY